MELRSCSCANDSFTAKRIGVVEPQGLRHHQTHLRERPPNLIDRLQVRALQNGFGQGSGVIRIHIDRAALQRLEHNAGAAHAELARHRNVRRGLDGLRRDLPEHVAFGERLRTHHDPIRREQRRRLQTQGRQ